MMTDKELDIPFEDILTTVIALQRFHDGLDFLNDYQESDSQAAERVRDWLKYWRAAKAEGYRPCIMVPTVVAPPFSFDWGNEL